MESEQIIIQPGEIKVNQSKGCSGLAAVILLSVWIIILTVIVQITNFTIVQMVFEGSIKMPNIRWIIELSYGALLLIPLFIAEKVVKDQVVHNRIKGLRNLAILTILFVPSRLPSVTDWQLTAALQVGALILFLLFLAIPRILKKGIVRNPEFRPDIGLALISAACGAILGIPWVLWGAQGSPTDTVLALVISTGLGFVAASVLITNIVPPTENLGETGKRRGIGSAGWIITLGLIILTTAVDQNGNGWILLFSVLPLGYACAALAYQPDGLISLPGRIAAGILVMLGFVWPMMMIDPDELSVVISSGTGELMEYATKGTAVAFGLALLVVIILIVIRKLQKAKPISFILGTVLFIFSWATILGLYTFLGKPGFYGEKVFVILKEQADLTAMNNIPDQMERRKQVYSSLIKNAESKQANIRSWLDSQGLAYKPYYLVNAIELDADPILRAELTARSDVDRVLDSPILRPLQNKIPQAKGFTGTPEAEPWNISLIGAQQVYDELKIYGQGVVVGQSDSGVQGDHPEFASQYRGNLDGSDDYNWFDPWNASTKPVDIGGHGTHTLGSILGKNVGVAPKAEWIGCVNLARNLGNPAFYLDCMQFMLAPFPQNGDPFKDGKPEKGANVLNNSWGCPVVEGCDPATYLPAVSALKTAGIFVVASAGNSGMGGCSTVQDPLAIYADVYSVGAVDKERNLASFSSIGPVDVDGSGRIKPDISAPGVDVNSAYPGSTYEIASGTSMAGPHVVGVVALMWSANPGLIGNVDKTRQILDDTADDYKGVMPECVTDTKRPNNAVGYGIVNAYKAVQRALEIR
jgi:hypothetical protein